MINSNLINSIIIYIVVLLSVALIIIKMELGVYITQIYHTLSAKRSPWLKKYPWLKDLENYDSSKIRFLANPNDKVRWLGFAKKLKNDTPKEIAHTEEYLMYRKLKRLSNIIALIAIGLLIIVGLIKIFY